MARLHRGNGSPCSAGLDLAIFLISRRWASVNTGGRPPAYLGYSEPKPSALKLCSTSRTRSSLVKASRAICATLMPCADHNTTCARRHVTTDPDPRRTIRFRRLPSSSLISRTRTRPGIPGSVTTKTPVPTAETKPPKRRTSGALTRQAGALVATDGEVSVSVSLGYCLSVSGPDALSVINVPLGITLPTLLTVQVVLPGIRSAPRAIVVT